MKTIADKVIQRPQIYNKYALHLSVPLAPRRARTRANCANKRQEFYVPACGVVRVNVKNRSARQRSRFFRQRRDTTRLRSEFYPRGHPRARIPLVRARAAVSRKSAIIMCERT